MTTVLCSVLGFCPYHLSGAIGLPPYPSPFRRPVPSSAMVLGILSFSQRARRHVCGLPMNHASLFLTAPTIKAAWEQLTISSLGFGLAPPSLRPHGQV